MVAWDIMSCSGGAIAHVIDVVSGVPASMTGQGGLQALLAYPLSFLLQQVSPRASFPA